jgi:hypothetical protein
MDLDLHSAFFTVNSPLDAGPLPQFFKRANDEVRPPLRSFVLCCAVLCCAAVITQ